MHDELHLEARESDARGNYFTLNRFIQEHMMVNTLYGQSMKKVLTSVSCANDVMRLPLPESIKAVLFTIAEELADKYFDEVEEVNIGLNYLEWLPEECICVTKSYYSMSTGCEDNGVGTEINVRWK